MGNLVEDGGLAVRAARPEDFERAPREGDLDQAKRNRPRPDRTSASRRDQKAGVILINGYCPCQRGYAGIALPRLRLLSPGSSLPPVTSAPRRK